MNIEIQILHSVLTLIKLIFDITTAMKFCLYILVSIRHFILLDRYHGLKKGTKKVEKKVQEKKLEPADLLNVSWFKIVNVFFSK